MVETADDGAAKPLRVFFAAPFTQLIESASGVVAATWRDELRSMYDALVRRGHSVFLAHEREAWGEQLMTPQTCTPLDYAEMQAADVVCAYVGNPPSHGVHIELGWASSMRKPILILTDDGVQYTPLLWGLGDVANTTYFPLAGRSLATVTEEVCDALDEVIRASVPGYLPTLASR
jgi:hypothetical protein